MSVAGPIEPIPPGAQSRPDEPGRSTGIERGAITLDNIVKRYGNERVVDSVTLGIRPGEFFSLLGPSGSGKTTTLMMIAGFASVDEGSVRVDGTDVSGIAPQRRGFGMVFQNYAIFPHLNVFENVAFPLRARRLLESEIKERVAWALGLVRLERFGDRYARQLSGGQQQRVAIARAIVFHPSVVLMDEPLGALDKNLRYDMQIEIKEIQQRLGMTVVYVTHDQEEAMNMSDRIAIMNRGQIEQVGPPTEIYERPANIFSGRFLGEANLINGTVARVDAGIAHLHGPNGIALRAAGANSVVVGTSVALFVRPERISIAVPANKFDTVQHNRMEGRVRRVSFLGNVLRYLVEVAPAIALTVDVQNSGSSGVEVGQTAVVTWPVEDSRLLMN
jgi:spermidine/putrescine ABC transporter ATP-binding subunit